MALPLLARFEIFLAGSAVLFEMLSHLMPLQAGKARCHKSTHVAFQQFSMSALAMRLERGQTGKLLITAAVLLGTFADALTMVLAAEKRRQKNSAAVGAGALFFGLSVEAMCSDVSPHVAAISEDLLA